MRSDVLHGGEFFAGKLVIETCYHTFSWTVHAVPVQVGNSSFVTGLYSSEGMWHNVCQFNSLSCIHSDPTLIRFDCCRGIILLGQLRHLDWYQNRDTSAESSFSSASVVRRWYITRRNHMENRWCERGSEQKERSVKPKGRWFSIDNSMPRFHCQ